MEKDYTITELAKEFAITTRTIRFYEEKQLLTPQRKGTSRIYSSKDRTILKLIIRGKRLGFSLEESRELISLYNPEQGNRAQLKRMIEKVSEKKAQLQKQLTDLQEITNELDRTEMRCQAALNKE
ncbi:MerR family DNA-binding transcriptional regulator [Deltaproteobacteria bacterium TL4]